MVDPSLEQPDDRAPSVPPVASEVHSSPLPSERAPRPGPVTDADDERLARLRRRVVEPVVRSLMTVDEVEALSVHWGVDGDPGDVWVRLDAPGGRYQDWLTSPSWQPGPLETPAAEAGMAAHLADHLQDWIAESAFGWGQWRRADHQLPAD